MLATFFKNKTALQSFIILIIGMLFLQVAGVFLFTEYYSRMRNQIPRHQFANDFLRSMRLLKNLKPGALQKHADVLNTPWIRFSYEKKALPNATVLDAMSMKTLRQFAIKHYHGLRASVLQQDGQWLNIRGGVPEHTWWLGGFIASEIFLFLVLLILCFWVVRQLAMPVTAFADAAKRFGMDVQAPPMAVQGSTEMREVAMAFNEMQSRVRRLIMDRTQMLAAISHDLRTPITRLQLRVEYLEGTPQYEKAVQDLQEMERMIASILSFARDYVRTEQMEKFDLNALLESICNELEDTGMNVSYHSEHGRLPFFGRTIALKRAITNIIENAVKYGDKATVTLQETAQNVQIKVADQGPGIPQAEKEKVFNPFYRIDPSRTPEKSGSGLGMAVARDIIRAHGGDITLHNTEPKGLVVTIALPLSP